MNITGWYNTPYMIVKSSSGTTYNSITLWPGGAFYTSKSTTTRPIITTSDSWSEISTTAFDASRSWTGVKKDKTSLHILQIDKIFFFIMLLFSW